MTETALEVIVRLEVIVNEIQFLIKNIKEYSFVNQDINDVEIEFDFYARIEFLFKEYKKETNILKDLIKGETND